MRRQIINAFDIKLIGFWEKKHLSFLSFHNTSVFFYLFIQQSNCIHFEKNSFALLCKNNLFGWSEKLIKVCCSASSWQQYMTSDTLHIPPNTKYYLFSAILDLVQAQASSWHITFDSFTEYDYKRSTFQH